MNDMTDIQSLMPDVQSTRDERRLAIQRVGVKDVRYPIQLRVGGQVQSSVATWDLDVALPANLRSGCPKAEQCRAWPSGVPW